MRQFALFMILILSQTFVFGQIKVAEYEVTDSDTESAYVAVFLNEVNKRAGSKGLIVIYTGANQERLGNILEYIDGVKYYIGYYSSKDKVSVVIAEGKKRFYKEFWIIAEGQKFPEIKSVDVDFSNLKTKYFYAADCMQCSPAVVGFSFSKITFDRYAQVLKDNDDYQGLIEIFYESRGKDAKDFLSIARGDAADYRRILTKDFRIKNKRVTIRIKKSTEKALPFGANLYIVPKAFKNKN